MFNTEKSQSRSRSNWAAKKVVLPGCRVTYPAWIAVLAAAILLAALLCASLHFKFRPFLALALGAGIITFDGVWWRDSNSTLHDRLPNAGWKSKIKPENLVLLTPNEFNGMRFELKGVDADDVDKHRVPWASRYSRDRLFLMRMLLVLAPLCLVCAVVMPTYTTNGSGAELPQTYNLTMWWLAACPVLLIAALLLSLDWNYRRILLDDKHLYLLEERPAWAPMIPGKNDPIPLTYIWSADPIDTWWGKQWGHGTVELNVLLDFSERRKIRLRRVPRHRDFCNVINSMTSESPYMLGGFMHQ